MSATLSNPDTAVATPPRLLRRTATLLLAAAAMLTAGCATTAPIADVTHVRSDPLGGRTIAEPVDAERPDTPERRPALRCDGYYVPATSWPKPGLKGRPRSSRGSSQCVAGKPGYRHADRATVAGSRRSGISAATATTCRRLCGTSRRPAQRVQHAWAAADATRLGLRHARRIAPTAPGACTN
jgi:hypothetical protein